MNPISKILSPLTNAVNSVIGGMNQRSIDMIRQTYMLIIVLLCILGAVIGFSSGKKSAKKTGSQMAETTNAVFDLDIQQSRTGGRFDAVLDNELESGLDMKDPQSKTLPAREKLSAEDTVRLAEPERDRHITPGPALKDKSGLAGPERLNNKTTSKDIRSISRPEEKRSAEITDKSINPLIEQPSASKDIRGDKIRDTKSNEKSKLKPMDKKGGLAE